jgi:FKBP-type peptidyl-prolyl cis-trans isomerase 2
MTSNDKIIAKGDKVSISYEGTFNDGEVFDSSKHGDHDHPIEFEVGSGQVIPGFDNAVIGMKVGEEKKFNISAKDAYGERNPALEQVVPRKDINFKKEPMVGGVLMMSGPDGQQIPLRITKVDKETLTIDLNHPLAGKDLNFSIKILEIK